MLSVLIPAYNEEGVIEATVRNLNAALSAASIVHEILVVNDGSEDGTELVLIRLENEVAALRHVTNPGPHGYGYAVRCGLDHYSGDAVVITMADGSDAPADVVAYFRQIEAGYDCAFGSRFTGAAKVKGYPAFKRVLNRLGNRLIGLTLGSEYDDFTNGFKCYRHHVIDSMRPLASGQFNLTIEMSMKAVASGARYAVAPTDWRDREGGNSKFKVLAQARLYLLTLLYTLVVVRVAPALAIPARPAAIRKKRYTGTRYPIVAAVRSWPMGRPALFLLVGFSGLGVYMGVLTLVHYVWGITFIFSNITAVLVAMISNFAFNNVLTYGDRRLKGLAFLAGLLSFAIACSAGAVVNIVVAEKLYRRGLEWGLAGFVGALGGAVFNYVATARVTWGAGRDG